MRKLRDGTVRGKAKAEGLTSVLKLLKNFHVEQSQVLFFVLLESGTKAKG